MMGHLAAAEQAKQDRPVRLKASIIIGYKHVRWRREEKRTVSLDTRTKKLYEKDK